MDFVVKGRANEKRAIEASMAGGHSYPMRYEYHTELFSIRRKEFWPLLKAKSLLQNFIPTLSHESDGLIFQVPESGAAQFQIDTAFSHDGCRVCSMSPCHAVLHLFAPECNI